MFDRKFIEIMLNLNQTISIYYKSKFLFLLYVEEFELKDKLLPNFDSFVLIDQQVTMHRANHIENELFQHKQRNYR